MVSRRAAVHLCSGDSALARHRRTSSSPVKGWHITPKAGLACVLNAFIKPDSRKHMNKIIEYRTVEAPARELWRLDKEVNNLIAEGYQPYGDPFTTPDGVRQAMIKQQNELPAEALGNPGFSSAS